MMNETVTYRNATLGDVQGITELEMDVWGEEMAAVGEKWLSRIGTFSKGIWVAEKDGKIIGVVVTHIVDWNHADDQYPTWAEVTADGYISNHNDEGDVLYGVDLTTVQNEPGVAAELLKLATEKAKGKQMYRGLMGARIPTLHRHFPDDSIDLSQDQVMTFAPKDPTVKFFLQQGFRALGAKEGYFPEDADSRGWGLILEVA